MRKLVYQRIYKLHTPFRLNMDIERGEWEHRIYYFLVVLPEYHYGKCQNRKIACQLTVN